MSVQKHRNLVSALIERTAAGKLDWKPGVSSDEFQVSFKNSSLVIAEETREGVRDIVILILNEEGEVVERFTDVDLDQGDFEEISWYARMLDLLNMARRSALGSDRVLNDILSELGRDV